MVILPGIILKKIISIILQFFKKNKFCKKLKKDQLTVVDRIAAVVVAGRGDLRVLVVDAGLFNAFSFSGDVTDVRDAAGFDGETTDPLVNFDLTVNVFGFGGALEFNFFLKNIFSFFILKLYFKVLLKFRRKNICKN